LDDAGRLAIWNELPARLDQLAVRARLLPWTRDELKRWIISTLADWKGTWVTGVPGAVAEFPVRPERAIEIEANDAAIEAQATDAHLRLTLHDKLRGFAFADAGPIVLALPRNRATLPHAQGFTSLGVDRNAVGSRHRTHELFDLGLGRQCCRFMLRTSSAAFADAMRGHEGKALQPLLRDAGAAILQESPHRVVESALARIEVFARIPRPGEKSPEGAHTHLLPSFLESGTELPSGLAIPAFACPIAIYYPLVGDKAEAC
jgi:DNA-directed RNA polymerase subunit N (RpoN/RPB10)